ncbi:MAG: oligosaccharide flippase family protein [Pyrinomonadaceae bacterium]|nr:oligosaccharide flippase family protein [Pyrinomonadaceae bacterium]
MSVALEKNIINPNKRLVKNAIFSALSWFLPIILTVFGTPVIVKGLGYEQYGLYALILGFISYSFTFGIGRAVTKYVSEYNSSDQKQKISEVISTTFWFSILLCLIGGILLIATSEYIVRDVLQINKDFHDPAIYGLYLASGSICLMLVGQVFQGVLQAIHRFDQVSILITLNGFIQTAGNVALVLMGFGFNSLLIWSLFTGGLNSFLYYYFARKNLPEFRIKFVFSREIVKLIFNFSLGIIGYQIFSNILLIFERSWITRKLGAENLTYYVVPMTLALYLHAFISSLIIVIFPAISELRFEPEKLLKLYQRATKVIFMIIAFCALTMICSGKLFLSLWLGQDFAEKSALVLSLQTISFSVFGLLVVVWQLSEGFGHPRFNSMIAFIWLLISVPLMVVLIDDFKIVGVATGRTVANLLTLPFILIGESQFLGKIHWDFWLKTIFILTTASFFTFVAEFGIYNFLPQKWETLIFGSLAGGVIFVAVIWALNFFSNEEKLFMKNFLRRA